MKASIQDERLRLARNLLQLALSDHPNQTEPDEFSVELIRATASIDRARKALAENRRAA